MRRTVHLATPHGLAVCGHRMKTGHRKKLEFVVLEDKDSITCVSCKRVANIRRARDEHNDL